mmetsp:Transcript_56078/g.64336  ORF Transcript_56078/g.64336 Transcript_56078/m.64336 type:complete len:103 (-) Transcript_56078:270-578(-)
MQCLGSVQHSFSLCELFNNTLYKYTKQGAQHILPIRVYFLVSWCLAVSIRAVWQWSFSVTLPLFADVTSKVKKRSQKKVTFALLRVCVCVCMCVCVGVVVKS